MPFRIAELLFGNTEYFLASRQKPCYACDEVKTMEQTERNAHVRSVSKAMELLETLLARRAPMTLRELADAVGYPKSTVYALLSTLREHAMVEQRADGRYALGIRLFECGCAVSALWDVSRAARPYLERLAETAGGSAFLSILEGGHVISIDQCTGGAGVQVVPEVGSRLPLHATAQGKLLLSCLGAGEARRRLLDAGMPPYTPHTVTDAEALLAELPALRARGWAVEDGEYKIGLRAVAAAVRDGTGEVRCALGVVGLFRRVQSDEFQTAIAETTAAAAALSAALGAKG
ncbi:MAG: IclR family transcriptional regulator [Ruminococcaceae bacterium]|nr:IclR family transcriptional regulator [Oscillospiraceae bacterium]